MHSFGQGVAGRAPGWSGPSRVNSKYASYRYKHLTNMDIAADHIEQIKS